MNANHRRIVLAAAFAIFMTTLLMMAVRASAEPVDRDRAPSWAWSKNWEPCANDEPQPIRCVWDARHQGNGSGNSYLQTKRGRVIYISHRDAHRLLLPLYAA